MDAKVAGFPPDQTTVPVYWVLVIEVTGVAPVTGAVTPVMAVVEIVRRIVGALVA